MQSPRPAIVVFILFILLSIKEKARGSNQHLLVPSLSHLFLAMEYALYEVDFDWHPYNLETVRTYLIRGIDLFSVPCPNLMGQCLLCGGGTFKDRPEKGSLFEGERFPDWSVMFSVARAMGGMRKLERETRGKLEAAMSGLFFASAPGSEGQYCVLAYKKDSGNGLGDPDIGEGEETPLEILMETICMELGVGRG